MSSSVHLAYVICSTPRSGSTLLAEGLARTDRAGRPAEFFDSHPENDGYWQRRIGIPAGADYVDSVLAAASTRNSVSGIKLHWHQCQALRSKLLLAVDRTPGEATLDNLLRARVGTLSYLWLRRKNRVAQGISHYRARRTGVWQAKKGRGDQATPIDQTLEFDFEAIDRHVRLAQDADHHWADYFRRNRLSPLMLVYEDLVGAYAPTICGVLKYLGLPYEDLTISTPRSERQADERSREWEARYREIAAARASASTARQPAALAETTTRHPAEPRLITVPAELGMAEPGRLIAYATDPTSRMSIVASPAGRAWMEQAPRPFIEACAPMLAANQSGWLLLNPNRIAVTWDGGDGAAALTIEKLGGVGEPAAISRFGGGILTFRIPYLFRTPDGFNLHMRGPVNAPKDGIGPLETMVEADRRDTELVMNWKLTRPFQRIVFEEGEPIAMVMPLQSDETKSFEMQIRTADVIMERQDS